MSNEIGPIEPNPVGSVLSAGALKAKALADKLRISYTGPGANPEGSEMGAGELLFGRGPEALEQWAYGFPPWTGKGQTLGLKPEAIEIAALPTFGALGMSKAVAKGVAKAAPRILKKTLPSPVDLERRNFLKHAGAAVALTAAPTAIIKGIEHAAPRAVAKATVRAAARPTATEILKKMSGSAITDFGRTIKQMESVWEPMKYPKQARQHLEIQKAYNDLPKDFDVSSVYSKGELKDIDDFIARLPEDMDPEVALRRVLNDPDATFADYGKLGSKVDDVDIYNGDPLNDKMNEALEAMWQLDGSDLDLWIATGKAPDSYPKDLIPYLSRDYFGEASGKISGWTNEQGLAYAPERLLQRFLETSDNHLSTPGSVVDKYAPDSLGKLTENQRIQAGRDSLPDMTGRLRIVDYKDMK